MRLPIADRWKRLSWARRFMLASLAVLASGMGAVGWWVGREIETGVVHRTAATTALYVDSFVAPQVQELAESATLQPEHVAALSGLLRDTHLGRQIVAFKVWDAAGRVLYSTDASLIGKVFPLHGGLARAWAGQVTTAISDLSDEENAPERERSTRLLETYSPVRKTGSDQIIAVAEFYQTIDELQGEIAAAQRRSWLVVGAAAAAMYLLLAGFVRQASNTIRRQQAELRDQVTRLTELLGQNAALHERVRRAAARTAAVNERFLRRIGAELHDGPAQSLSLALLRLDAVMRRCEACPQAGANGRREGDELGVIQNALADAMREVRAISAGLGLPELGRLTLAETLTRVVRAHERRTATRVALNADDLPDQAQLPVKITLYRFVQEALNNAYRHAGGIGQRVLTRREGDQLRVEVADSGPGFDGTLAFDGDEHLGLVGMRERIESLGGRFRVESTPGRGSTVIAHLPLWAEEDHEREDPDRGRGRSPAAPAGGRPHARR